MKINVLAERGAFQYLKQLMAYVSAAAAAAAGIIIIVKRLHYVQYILYTYTYTHASE
jgi:hypothetical protein